MGDGLRLGIGGRLGCLRDRLQAHEHVREPGVVEDDGDRPMTSISGGSSIVRAERGGLRRRLGEAGNGSTARSPPASHTISSAWPAPAPRRRPGRSPTGARRADRDRAPDRGADGLPTSTAPSSAPMTTTARISGSRSPSAHEPRRKVGVEEADDRAPDPADLRQRAGLHPSTASTSTSSARTSNGFTAAVSGRSRKPPPLGAAVGPYTSSGVPGGCRPRPVGPSQAAIAPSLPRT